MQNSYTVSDIQVLEGLDAVRRRPGMYIGSTGQRGLYQLLWEIVDNAIDEAANGYADTIRITLHKDESVTVEDNGRGIPVQIHPQLGVSGVEVVFTHLHAGGKFDNKSYGYSGGLHGVGASVVNALSEWLVVEVASDGSLYCQEFHSYFDKTTSKMESGRPKTPLQNLGRTRKKGSKITFLPDARVFETIHMSFDAIAKRAKELSFLNKGIRMLLLDERERVGGEYRKKDYCYEGGIIDYIQYLNDGKTALHATPIFFEDQYEDIFISIAMQYTNSYTESIFSYVNNIPTTEGGTHETGFKAALTKIMNEYARRSGVLKEKDVNFAGEDLREGLTAVVSMKMRTVQFEGQTKTRLGNTEARLAVESVMAENLTRFLEDLNNAAMVGNIMDKAQNAARVREATRKAKSIARQKNKLEGAPLVGKLASCTGRKAEENELFIVEGDSAGGSAKQGRDRRFQAILPLRGKPLNAEKKRIDQVLANEEFRTIITALGTGIDEDFNIKGLKYNKIIILSDADQDGAHIRAILLTFFFRYMRELVANGHVYIGLPPLYKISKGKSTAYAYDDDELKRITKKMGRGYSVQRYKGLGEMNPEQLWQTTMSPQNRSLLRVHIDDAVEADRIVSVLMGDKVGPRKEYISGFANFNKKDQFEAEVQADV
jgi:DNA gyrase subunit B